MLTQLDEAFTKEETVGAFLKQLHAETSAYALRAAGGEEGKKKGKGAKKAKETKEE